MSKSLPLQVAALVAAVSLTLGTVAGMNALAADTYRTVSEAQLASTPMAFAQHVTVVGHRSSHA